MWKQAYDYGVSKALFDAGLIKEASLHAAWKSLKNLNKAVETQLGGANAVAETAKKIQVGSKASPLRKATATAEDANRMAKDFLGQG